MLLIPFILSNSLLFSLTGTVSANSDPNDMPVSHQTHEPPGEPITSEEYLEAEKLDLNKYAPDLSSTSSVDPIELAGLFEGDIVLSDDGMNGNGGKNGITDPSRKWPGGVVPYTISNSYNNDERMIIARAMVEFERETCIQFRPWRGDQDYIRIIKGNGCSSPIGRIGGPQDVSVGDGCVYPGIVMHELTHSVGFHHEHSRPDRDDHVTIHFENIQPGAEPNFEKEGGTQTFGVPYDTSSVMHYGPFAFTKSRRRNKRTITPKVPNDDMGQRRGFTENDTRKINILYNCQGTASQQNNQDSPSSCLDNHQHCQQWASNGECQKNPNWMLANCKKSCNQCSNNCSDDNPHCDYWAGKGECGKNPGYMHVHCKKACKRC